MKTRDIGSSGTHVCNSNGRNDRGDEIEHDDKSHRETAETAELFEEHQLAQVVNSRVDPTTLRKQNLPTIRGDSEGVSVADELCLMHREVPEQQCREITIFSRFFMCRVSTRFSA